MKTNEIVVAGIAQSNPTNDIKGEVDECSGFRSFLSHIRKYIKNSSENKEKLIKYVNQDFIPYDKFFPNKEKEDIKFKKQSSIILTNGH